MQVPLKILPAVTNRCRGREWDGEIFKVFHPPALNGQNVKVIDLFRLLRPTFFSVELNRLVLRIEMGGAGILYTSLNPLAGSFLSVCFSVFFLNKNNFSHKILNNKKKKKF